MMFILVDHGRPMIYPESWSLRLPCSFPAWICHRERREHREPPVRGFPAIFLATPEIDMNHMNLT